MHFCHSVSLDVSGVVIGLSADVDFSVDRRAAPFVTDKAPQYRVSFKKADRLNNCFENPVYEGNGFVVSGEKGFPRLFLDTLHGDAPYAEAFYDLEKGEIEVNFLESGIRFFENAGVMLGHVALESILIREKRAVLHAGLIDSPLGGVLFSGPSGIGKSTQCELWCEHAGAELINGDRPIILKTPEGLKAFGSPYAGSSNCYKNKSCDIKAVVFLSQNPECKISRLSGFKAFKKLFSQLTVNSWDKAFVSYICDFASDMAASVPCFEFGCPKDKAAVEFLSNALRRELNV